MKRIIGIAHLDCVSPKGAFYCIVSHDKPEKTPDLAKDLLQRSHWKQYSVGSTGWEAKTICASLMPQLMPM